MYMLSLSIFIPPYSWWPRIEKDRHEHATGIFITWLCFSIFIGYKTGDPK